MTEFPVAALPDIATERLQAAIDRAHAAGGGRVIVAAGRHETAGLRLKSGVDLHLAEGAVLAAVAAYDAYAHTRVSSRAEDSDRAIIVAEGAEGIALTGRGRIEGNGDSFTLGDDGVMGTLVPARHRPRVLVLDGCRDVRISGITISRSPMWTIHAIDCDELAISDIRVDNNLRMPNTDGIVIDASRGVFIENVDISTADDGIVLKTTARPDGTPVGVCRDVTVARAHIVSRSCALKIGTESFGEVSGIVFADCTIARSNRGLGIFSRDGGTISNVRFENIAVQCEETADGFWGSGEALTINAVDRRPDRPAGQIADIVVRNVTGAMEGAINLIADAPDRIRDVTIEDVAIAQRPGALGTGRQYDLRPTNADLAPAAAAEGRANAWVRGPDGKVVGLTPYPGGMPGLFAANVTRLTLRRLAIARPEPLPPGWNPAETVSVP